MKKLSKMFLSIVLIFSLFIANSSAVLALPDDQRKILDKGIYYYDIDPGCSLDSGNEEGDSEIIVRGDSVEFPLTPNGQPRVDNQPGPGTATELSPPATRGALFVRFVGHKQSIDGIRVDDPRFAEEHPSGNALDLHSSKMGTALTSGPEFEFFNSLATTLAKNHEALSVSNIIWNNRIISERDGFKSWRPYSGYGSTTNPTLQHRDHIHVRFNSKPGKTTITLYGNLKPGSVNLSSDPGVENTEITESTRDIDVEDLEPGGQRCACPDPTAGNTSSTSPTTLRGGSNIEQAFNFFVDKGFSPTQSGGILGNLYEESHLDPKIVEGGSQSETVVSGRGYGIAQWTFPARQQALINFAKEQSKPVSDLGLQLDFIFKEMSDGLKARLKRIDGSTEKAIGDAAFLFHKEYEKSADTLSMIQERVQSGIKIFNEHSNGATSSGETGFAIVNSDCGNANQDGGATNFVDNFPIYFQYDPKWANAPYSSSTIGRSGCGPAAMAMIITALTGQQITPIQTANYAAQQGMYVPNAGSKWTISPVLAKHWGLKSRSIAKNEAAIKEALESGALVVASGQGPKPFTSGGHFIVIRAITDTGKFKVGDSGHNDTNDKDWDTGPIISSMNDGSIYAIYK